VDNHLEEWFLGPREKQLRGQVYGGGLGSLRGRDSGK
jgi:hypothetical protein